MAESRIGDETRAKIARHWPDLLAALANNGTIKHFAAELGVTPTAIRIWRLEQGPARIQEWEQAREQSADYYADKVVETVEDPKIDPQTARVRMDAYRWLAAKRNPRIYNDKATLDVNVRQIDLTAIIRDAQARLMSAHGHRVIEHSSGDDAANARAQPVLPAELERIM